ncbi:helix-turn-helix domain-containing protein [Massilia sp. YIM B04103]|uniref:AraC family transcriptional regulator n=1 Tax=Massilia sp. YIM B04103 TaxID=2963106 RepID=UPI00210ABDA7|nr:helix-turn-helix transcriptional regulator [Massilia sp. YIM B04103]
MLPDLSPPPASAAPFDPAADPASDPAERADGPALIALWAADARNPEFGLGTREYDWHRHLRGQLFCVESGLIHVRTRHGSWLLPPHRAGWIPPGEAHQVSISGAMSGWAVLVAPAASAVLPAQPCVLGNSALLRALVQRAADWSGQSRLSAHQERLLAVLLDEVALAPRERLHLPLPSDRRLQRIAAAILAEPGAGRTLAQWAAWGGLSARSLSRLFLAETGCSFAQWRQQAQLLRALERLAQGEAVASVADALGYANPSSFIAMFRRSFGDSPARYFSGKHD